MSSSHSGSDSSSLAGRDAGFATSVPPHLAALVEQGENEPTGSFKIIIDKEASGALCPLLQPRENAPIVGQGVRPCETSTAVGHQAYL